MAPRGGWALTASVLAVVVLSTVGCGGGGESNDGAGAAGGAGGEAGMAGSRAFVPEAPRLNDWTCPSGWESESVLEGEPYETSVCTPPAPPASCPDGQMAVLGSSQCVDVGAPCPGGDFADGDVYVAPGGAGDGTSPSSPVGSIAQALANAPTGAIIALAKGTYREAVVLDRPATLRGACARETIIEAPSPDDDGAVIRIGGTAGASLENLWITGPSRGVWVLGNAEPVTIAGVIFRGVARGAITFAPPPGETSAGGMIRDVLIEDMRGRSDDGSAGVGLSIQFGTHVTVERLTIDGALNHAVDVLDPGSRLEMTDVLVRDTAPDAATLEGGEALVADGAELTARRVLLERNHSAAVLAFPNASIVLEDVTVRDTKSQQSLDPADDGIFGRAVVSIGGAVDVRRGLFEGNRDNAVLGGQPSNLSGAPPSVLTLEDIVVRDTAGRASDGTDGWGLGAQDGTTLSVTRGIFLRNRDHGIYVSSGSTAQLADVVVADTQSQESNGQFGRGLAVQNGATVDVVRAVFIRNRDVGVFVGENVSGSMPSLTMADVLISGTQPQACGDMCIDQPGGDGLGTAAGLAEVSRFSFTRNAAKCGVIVGGAGIIELHDGDVSNNLFGVCPLEDGYDLSLLEDGVLFVGNEKNVETDSMLLELPSASDDDVTF